MSKDLATRMKEYYENRSKTYLTRRMPVIIRLDGKCFSKYTKGMKKPFDKIFIKTMQDTALYLCKNIQGCKMAYVQSDEISLLITDYETLNTDAPFDYNIQKLTSISASMATLAFNNYFKYNVNQMLEENKEEDYINKMKSKFYKALFDSRAFNIPKEEVNNYFVWRQNDATRNSIQSIGIHYFSKSSLHKKSCNDIQDMLLNLKQINFNDLETEVKRGSCVIKEIEKINNIDRSKFIIDKQIPIFSKNNEYVERFI